MHVSGMTLYPGHNGVTSTVMGTYQFSLELPQKMLTVNTSPEMKVFDVTNEANKENQVSFCKCFFSSYFHFYCYSINNYNYL